MYNGEITYIEFDSWNTMNDKFLELTKDLKQVSFFELSKFESAYLFSDEKIYIVEYVPSEYFEDVVCSLEIVNISNYILNMQKEIEMIRTNHDNRLDNYHELLKERNFLFNKMNEVMPVYNNASIIAEENERLLKENLELKSSKEALSKFASCSEKVIGELKYEIELLKAGIPYNKED